MCLQLQETIIPSILLLLLPLPLAPAASPAPMSASSPAPRSCYSPCSFPLTLTLPIPCPDCTALHCWDEPASLPPPAAQFNGENYFVQRLQALGPFRSRVGN